MLIVLSGLPGVGKKILCSSVDEHRRRVEARVADIAGHRLPTWTEVLERDYRPWDVDRLVVDTARLNVQQSVQAILSAISLDPHAASGRTLMS